MPIPIIPSVRSFSRCKRFLDLVLYGETNELRYLILLLLFQMLLLLVCSLQDQTQVTAGVPIPFYREEITADDPFLLLLLLLLLLTNELGPLVGR